MGNEKWIKLGARNLYPLHWSGIGHSVKNVKISNLYFSLLKYLAIHNGGPLSIDFEHSKIQYETNFDNFITEINPEIDEILTEVENTIQKDLKFFPSSKRENILRFYNSYKQQVGFMYSGYYFTQIALDRLRKVVGESEFVKIQSDVTQPHKTTLVAREHHAIEKLKKEYNDGVIDTKKMIEKAEKLAEKFGFIHSEYKGTEWEVSNYLKEIKSG